MDLIDVHTHIVPKTFPVYSLPEPEKRWPCMQCSSPTEASIVIDNKPFRALDHRAWDMGKRLSDMASAGVTRQVLSPMPELLSYWFKPDAGLEMCRWMNQTIATAVSDKPDSFSGLGIVPLQDPDMAAKELGRLKSDGFAGIELGSNINGDLLGDPKFDGFFAEAAAQQLSVFVHALHPVGAERLKLTPELIPFAAFPLDTALTAISLIHAGIPVRYPNLKFGFSHGGGAIVSLVHRLSQGWKLTSGFGGRLPQTPMYYAARFFYDSLVYDSGYLGYLANEFAPAQVFCGTDYPFAIMETNLEGFVTAAEVKRRDSIRYESATRFLGL
jgi:aminocarboxymuconate-semialdehyde decarboxylase